jgi:Na+/melibiose symporter-like transporter
LLFEFAIENLGRPIVAPLIGLGLFPVAAAAFFLYRRHARNTQAPVLDLELLQIKTFRIGTLTGGICRVGLDATPFLLPLFFQIGFGLSPLRAGLLSFSSTLGAMFVRSFSRAVLRVFGFRRTLVGGAVLSALVGASYALFDADTPAWVIVLGVLVGGCVRSIQYLALNTVSYADVPSALLSRSTSVGGVVQQLARGFGVAIGAALLAIVAGSDEVTTGDFRIVLVLIALIPLCSAAGFLRLTESDGAEVSGHRTGAAVQPAAR